MRISLPTPGRLAALGVALLGAATLTVGVLPATGATPAASTRSASAALAAVRNLTAPPQSRHGSSAPFVAMSTTGRSSAAVSAWKSIPEFPTPIEDNTVAANAGTVYSVLGWNGSAVVSSMYSLAPGASKWKKLASAPTIRSNASGAFINGKFYVTGGWTSTPMPTGEMDIYNPATNTWSKGATSPVPSPQPPVRC